MRLIDTAAVAFEKAIYRSILCCVISKYMEPGNRRSRDLYATLHKVVINTHNNELVVVSMGNEL